MSSSTCLNWISVICTVQNNFSLERTQTTGTISLLIWCAQYTCEEKCRITPAPPTKHSRFSSFSLCCGQRGRAEWRLDHFFLNRLQCFSFPWSAVHCAQLHTFLSLDYSVWSVAHVTLSSIPVALTIPPASFGLKPSTALPYLSFILFTVVSLLCVSTFTCSVNFNSELDEIERDSITNLILKT